MVRKLIIQQVLAWTAVILGPANVKADTLARSDAVDTAVVRRVAAVAVSSIGVDQAKLARPYSLTVTGVETLVGTTTPFLHSKLNGKRVWRVNINDVPFQDSLTLHYEASPQLRDFTILVDSASGIVTRVITRGPHFDESVIRRASASCAEEQLSQIAELYVGMPTLAPAVSLNNALKWSAIPPEVAVEVVADYLIFEEGVGHHKGPHAAWVVNMNGGFIFGCVPDSLDKACNNYRLVVDAQTGESLSSTNWPNPPAKQ